MNALFNALYFFKKCSHFNALYFRNERAEQLWSSMMRSPEIQGHFTRSRSEYICQIGSS